jgi:acetoin utilization deacetylase AcuC-like enzyme
MPLNTFIVHDPLSSSHLTGFGHPEAPERYHAVVNALKTAGLLRSDNSLKPRLATRAEILLCHSEDYYQIVRADISRALKLGLIHGEYTLSTGDVQISPESWEAAHGAAGAVLTAIDSVMEGRASNAFCVVRPPGHHASRSRGIGFCLFNNVAIGARYLQQRYQIKRVLIVDWDVHHGNGTQDLFEHDPSVFFLSTHQAHIFPGSGLSEERGVGNLLNFPIRAGLGSREAVLAAFAEPLEQAMAEFKPEFVLISAGFDAHKEDPIGGFNLMDQDFYTLTKGVMRIADRYAKGRVVSVLEGGYNLEALGRSAVAHVKALEEGR